jgi:hypothetical protein
MERTGHATEWWTGLTPVDTTIRCCGAGHRIRWERGELVACDHGDPDDERALAALGGERYACIDLLDAWARHTDDLRALVRSPRGARDAARAAGWTLEHGGRGDAAVRPPTFGAELPVPSVPRIGRFPIYPRSWDEGEAELIALLGLGGGVADRLVATVAATWARRLRPGANVVPVAVPRLRAALHARLLTTLRGWLGEPGLSLTLELVGEVDPRSLSRVGGRVRAELPFAWLAEVWARGFQLVDGRFCLAAQTGDGDGWELTTVAPDLHTIQRMTLSAAGLPLSDRAPL